MITKIYSGGILTGEQIKKIGIHSAICEEGVYSVDEFEVEDNDIFCMITNYGHEAHAHLEGCDYSMQVVLTTKGKCDENGWYIEVDL